MNLNFSSRIQTHNTLSIYYQLNLTHPPTFLSLYGCMYTSAFRRCSACVWQYIACVHFSLLVSYCHGNNNQGRTSKLAPFSAARLRFTGHEILRATKVSTQSVQSGDPQPRTNLLYNFPYPIHVVARRYESDAEPARTYVPSTPSVK